MTDMKNESKEKETIYKKRRIEKGLTQEEVCRAVNMSKSGYWNIEKGLRKPQARHKRALNQFLEIEEKGN